jgi:hypothetical protein
MTQADTRLESALARLGEALDLLEAVSRRTCGEARSPDMPDLASALAAAQKKAARLEAANAEVSRVLELATGALAAIVTKQTGPNTTPSEIEDDGSERYGPDESEA